MINSELLLLLLLLLFIFIVVIIYYSIIITAQGISISIYRCAHSNVKNGFDVLLSCNFFGRKA